LEGRGAVTAHSAVTEPPESPVFCGAKNAPKGGCENPPASVRSFQVEALQNQKYKEKFMKMFSMRLISFVMIIGLVFAGCSNGGDSPAKVVRQYYAALAKGDAKTIGVVMTPKGAENLTPFMEKAKDHVAALGEITSTEETIDGDTGVVKVTFKNGSTEEIDVVKADGKWRVSEWESFSF
jgi:hypothetical protein